ncbi:hypothetical protein Cch01nite_03250 [Cellulomonas chitinilytica]|uniref:Uncharacterized protein n=1 Tax=Cellulomonas chitinilytica TaxID=398759 RepID=A0A919NXV1_9CELL|nr:hypothetical protein [Cellulomonas chitinilytica]GIG19601.1 hypothetical protein Cch01nite_03250 [Cellulomonas chitinilytica]
MNGDTRAPARPQVLLTIAVVVIALIAAGTFGFSALLLGSGFAAGPPAAPGTSVVLWVLSGAALAAPVALLPTLGFPVRRRTSLVVAVAVVVTAALVGVLGLNQD